MHVNDNKLLYRITLYEKVHISSLVKTLNAPNLKEDINVVTEY